MCLTNGGPCTGNNLILVEYAERGGKALSSPKKSSENQNGSGVRYEFMKQDNLYHICAALRRTEFISRRRGEEIELRFQVEPMICVENLHNIQGRTAQSILFWYVCYILSLISVSET